MTPDLRDARSLVELAFDHPDRVETETLAAAVEEIIGALDRGDARAAERDGAGVWTANEWAKKAILLSFRLWPMRAFDSGRSEARAPGPAHWDKIPLKTAGWGPEEFTAAGFRCAPGSIVRRGAFVARGAVLMPSFVNIGAFVDEEAMIDTWATVGSCAQIGKRVHVSGGAGIGGVLEPLQATPVIVEDDAFIGARSEIAEGVIVREGAVISMGVFISASTKIVDRATGAVTRGEVPAGAVVVPGALPDPNGGPSLACAVIVKRVDARTRAKTSITDILRE
ncbi:MAG: 2,3,4,5-tetrahydropyridine-2,6-dicarboxylate N-succinyltransferase [Caulobacterales bacterium]|nr:2,3,4,5-tetrahydropyridine-2,6-dicarboxylate N-succinyltransferase [Caulobacterales bacterium]